MLKELYNIFSKKIWLIILFFSTSLIIAIISLTIPYITGKYIDILSTDIIKNNISLLIIGYFIVNTLDIIFSYIQNLMGFNLKSKISYEITNYFIEYLSQVNLTILQKYDSVYLSQRISLDSNKITEFILGDMYKLFFLALNIISMIIILVSINVKIGILVTLGISLNILIYFYFEKKINKCSLDYFESQNNFSDSLSEPFKFLKIIRIHELYIIFKKKLSCKFESFFNSLINYAKVTGIYTSLESFISISLSTILLIICSNEVTRNNLTVGQITMILAYFFSILANSKNLFSIGKNFQETKVSYNRMLELFNLETEVQGNKIIDKINSIELCNISYIKNKKYIIKNLNFTFKKGSIYAITGFNGAGKSTLLYLIIKIIKLSYGNIYINDTNIDLLDMNFIRKNKISFLEQEPMIIKDSIYNNLTYNIVDTSNLNKYIDLFGLDSYLKNFDKGIYSYIESGLGNISGGEKQKIGLIRSFLKDKDLIILDEPTSALDMLNCNVLKKHLQKIKKNKIIILVTHDKDLLEIADSILNMDEFKST